jgi:autotransporter-associated beta strand protein
MRTFLSSVRLLCLATLLTASVQAQTLLWDGAGVGTTGAQGGAGTWDMNTTANWWDGSANVVWSNTGTDNDATFAGTAGAVTISSVTANDLTFTTTGYTLEGPGTLTLNGSVNLITTASSVTATLGNNTALVLAGSSGFTKAGAGTLKLNPTVAATYTGTTTINAGRLVLDYSNLGTNATNLLPSANNLAFAANKSVDATLLLQNTVGSGATAQTLGTITNGRGTSYILADPAAGTTLALSVTNIALGGTRGWNSTSGTMIIGVMSAAQESQFTFNLTSTTAIDNGGIVTGSFLYTLDGGVDPANLYFAQKSGSVVSRRTADVNTTDSYTGTASTEQIRVTTTTAGQSWTNTGDISARKGLLFVGANDYTIAGGTFGNSIPGSGTQNTRGIIIATWGTGALTITSNVTNGNGNAQLTKQGPGTLILTYANTYPSATNLNGGVLSIAQIANGGTASGLGQSGNSASNLNLDGGTLRYTGAAASTDRLFTLNADSGLDASGSGALNWTNTGTYTVSSSTGPKTLTLKGTNTDANTLSGLLSDQDASTGLVSLVKAGAGTWVLNHANTYSGGTTVSGGTLKLNYATALGTGAVTVTGSDSILRLDGATLANAVSLDSGGTLFGSGGVGSLSVLSGGRVSLGDTPGTLTAGNTTLAGGGSYIWKTNDATGASGTATDLLSVSGTLTISATNANRFTLTLRSLLANNTAGDVINFNSAASSSYTIASASSGIIGFAADSFTVDSSGFSNANSSLWAVAQSGNNLTLNYTAIPEPATYAALVGAGALGLAVIRRRRAAS